MTKEISLDQLAFNIKSIRRAWRLNQEDFGQLFGYSKFNIKSYEGRKAKPPLALIYLLSKQTGIVINDLIDMEINKDDVPALKDGPGLYVSYFTKGDDYNLINILNRIKSLEQQYTKVVGNG